jgi:hypothetical protein
MPKRTLSLELYDFFSYIKGKLGKVISSITSSAFTQQRHKLSPDVFVDMNHLLISEFYQDNEERVQLWNGFRVLSVDGSKLTLPFSEELKQEYGIAHNQNAIIDLVQGRASVLYDVLNQLVIDALLTNPEKGEITLAHEHVSHVRNGDLIIFDRGYPSFELGYEIFQKNADFIFRCRHEFNNVTKQFISSGIKESIVEINSKQNGSFEGKGFTRKCSLKVRLISIPLESGEIELLMTSLTDMEKFPYDIFKPLYFLRWNIESFYNRIKNILALENFSGLCSNAIKQDFYCAMFISNVQSLIIDEAKSKVDKNCNGRKYEYKINTSVSLGFMKYRIIDLFMEKGAERALQELEKLLVNHLVPIKGGRKFKREKDKYRTRKKPPMFSNRKKVL